MVLALAVMVKNEAHIVERLVESCLQHIDCVIVSDTGSTDNTVQKFEEICSKYGLPLFVDYVEWKDFGYNRTQLLRFAEGKADWLLLGDADLTFSFTDKFDLTSLKGEAFLLPFEGPEFYRKVLLVRNNKGWFYKGRTHEYIDSDIVDMHLPYDEIVAFHHADGGSRGDKYERDAKLLLQDFEDPKMAEDRQRIAFYLGQTFDGLEQWAEAYRWYKVRSELGGWEEERWLAEYRAARLTNDIDAVMGCWEKRPHRLEPLYTVSVLSMGNKDWVWAEMFLRHGLFLVAAGRVVNKDILFVDTWIYSYGLKTLLTVVLIKLGVDIEAKHGIASLAMGDDSYKFLLNCMEHYDVEQEWIDFARDARKKYLPTEDI